MEWNTNTAECRFESFIKPIQVIFYNPKWGWWEDGIGIGNMIIDIYDGKTYLIKDIYKYVEENGIEDPAITINQNHWKYYGDDDFEFI